MSVTVGGGFLTLAYALLAAGENEASVEVTADFCGATVEYTVAATGEVEDEMTSLVSRIRRLVRCVETDSLPEHGDSASRAYENLGIHVTLEHLSSEGFTLALAVREPRNRANGIEVRRAINARWMDDFFENLEDGVHPDRHPITGDPASRRRR